MRSVSQIPRLLLVLLAGACQSGTSHDAAPKRTFRFAYTVNVPVPTDGTKTLDIWVPLAQTDPGVQRVSDVVIHAPTGYSVNTEAAYGNKMIHARINNPSDVTKISWSATIERWEDHGQGSLGTDERFLRSNHRISIKGKASEMAVELGVSGSGDVHNRAKVIYNDVLSGMVYDKKHSGWGKGDFVHATTVCKGNCTDFHSRFIGVGRAAGIPVRFTMGIPMKPMAKGEHNGYHCWAHYHDGKSWHPVDISEADKVSEQDPTKAELFFRHLDQHRVSVTFGRDIDLAPKQAEPALNYFVFPYAEADGKPVEMDKPYWKFTYEDVN